PRRSHIPETKGPVGRKPQIGTNFYFHRSGHNRSNGVNIPRSSLFSGEMTNMGSPSDVDSSASILSCGLQVLAGCNSICPDFTTSSSRWMSPSLATFPFFLKHWPSRKSEISRQSVLPPVSTGTGRYENEFTNIVCRIKLRGCHTKAQTGL